MIEIRGMIKIFQTGGLFCLISIHCLSSTWTQWRGSERNGIASGDVNLLTQWKGENPPMLWESDEIPSNDYGGFSSIISDSKNAYLSLVWHKDVPTETRTISDLVLRKIGARKINLPPDLVEKVENARLSLSPRLRGSNLDDWISNWILKNLDLKQRLSQGDYLASRFKKGKLALPIEVINELYKVKNKVFPSQKDFDLWLREQNFDQKTQNEIAEAVPPTKQVAEDVVLALDLDSGSILWKTSLDSVPTGRKSSSTPCLINGKIFAIGSERIYCIDSISGSPLWDQALPTKEIASSILPYQKSVVVLAGNLRAYDQENGNLLWENKMVKGKAASPVIWELGKEDLIVCNSSKNTIAVNPKDGTTYWEGPGGGSSTPVCNQEIMLVHGKKEEVGLIAYQFAEGKISELWRIPKLTRRTDSSPIIYNGYAYLIGAGMRLCVNVESGEVIRKVIAKHDISSPILADGKILAYEIKGNFLKIIDSNPKNFEEIQKIKVNALQCTSPSLAGTKLLIRQKNRIVCFELGEFNSP